MEPFSFFSLWKSSTPLLIAPHNGLGFDPADRAKLAVVDQDRKDVDHPGDFTLLHRLNQHKLKRPKKNWNGWIRQYGVEIIAWSGTDG